jgi:hypothetical protein
MASTYVNDLRLNEMATGDGSGTWGTTTNTNLELIAEAFSYGTEVITTNADADAYNNDSRWFNRSCSQIYIPKVYFRSFTRLQTRTFTIAPNTCFKSMDY